VAVWHDAKLQELASQLTYSPAEKRLEQIAGAAVLIDEVDPQKNLPWDYAHYRITGFRPKDPTDHELSGKTLRADLSTFIEFISETLEIHADAQGEAVLTLEEVSRNFGVSSKTIQRWRKQGLIAQRYVFGDGRKKLGFLRSYAAKFAAANADRVSSAANFRQLSDEERAGILRWARRMAARPQGRMKEISRRIAKHFGRSPETIRYTIRKHDQENPSNAIFPGDADAAAKLDRQIVTACFDQGVSIESLAERFSTSQSSIHRLVMQEKALRLKSSAVEFVANPLYEHPDADTIILDVLPKGAEEKARQPNPPVAAGKKEISLQARDLYAARLPKDLPAYLAGVFLEPAMHPAVEEDLVRRMNYLKYKAAVAIEKIEPRAAKPNEIAAAEALLARAGAIKNQLVQANLRVAIHVARKHQRPGLDLLELISDATIWLMRAVEKFDFTRHVRLGTYASLAIMKNFARDRAEQLTRRDARFVTGQEERLSEVGERDAVAVADQVDSQTQKRDLMDVIDQLPERERELVLAHYGFDENASPLSLAELGDKMGITKARVRQLETRALKKLRELLESRRVEKVYAAQ
jgi:RNA polymerase sigma factor (sigma-70 family)